MSLRSKKFVQKIKVIKYKEERKEIEIVKLEPKCSVPKKPKKIVTDEQLQLVSQQLQLFKKVIATLS